MTDDKQKIIKNPNRFKLSFVTVLFGMLSVYFIIQAIIFFSSPRTYSYDIGSPINENLLGEFNGIILRDEKCIYSHTEGRLNFYVSEGELLRKDTLVCSTDNENDLKNEIKKLENTDIKVNELITVSKTIESKIKKYDSIDFNTVSEIKSEISSKLFSVLLIESANAADILTGASYHVYNSTDKCFPVFSCDGYEEKTPEELTLTDFDSLSYVLNESKIGSNAKENGFLYKEVYNNAFRLVFLLDETRYNLLKDKKSVSVSINEGTEITGTLSFTRSKDGDLLGVIDFVKYGFGFLKDRHVSFTVKSETVSGYKVPKSCIVTRNYYVIESEFLFNGRTVSDSGVNVLINGLDAEFIKTSYITYNEAFKDYQLLESDKYVLIYSDKLKQNDTVFYEIEDENGNKTGRKETRLLVSLPVTGVYKINNGYSVFRPVYTVQTVNEGDYTIVLSIPGSGLYSFDKILLDADKFNENDIIFK